MAAFTLGVDLGALTFFSQSIVFQRGKSLPLAVGAFVLGGQAVLLPRAQNVARGTFAVAGRAVQFIAPGSVTYATIVNGLVTAIDAGALPPSTNDTLYFDLTWYFAPDIGWYFSEVCQSFSATVPPVAAGDIAPPFTPGGTPPDIPDDERGGDLPPDEAGPPIYATTIPMLLPFHADKDASYVVTAGGVEGPTGLTEVAARMRTAFDLRDVCALRVQTHVMQPSAGSLVLCFSTDGGTTWDRASLLDTGPRVTVAAAGTIAGLFTNIKIAAAGSVLLSVFADEGARGAVLGNTAAVALVAIDGGVCIAIDESGGCPLTGTFDEGINFASYADYTAFDDARPVGNLFGFWPNSVPNAAAVELLADSHGKHLVLHHNGGGVARNAYWWSTGLSYPTTMAVMMETALPLSAGSVVSNNTAQGQSGLLLFRNNDTFFGLRLANDRVYVGRDSGIDIGPSSALCDGTPKRIILELIETRVGFEVGVHANLYVDPACATGAPTFFGGTAQTFNGYEGPFTQMTVCECFDQEPTADQRVYKYAIGTNALAFEVL